MIEFHLQPNLMYCGWFEKPNAKSISFCSFLPSSLPRKEGKKEGRKEGRKERGKKAIERIGYLDTWSIPVDLNQGW